MSQIKSQTCKSGFTQCAAENDQFIFNKGSSVCIVIAYIVWFRNYKSQNVQSKNEEAHGKAGRKFSPASACPFTLVLHRGSWEPFSS